MKTFNSSKKVALFAVALLGATSFASGAQAGDIGPDGRTVQYADLNLNTSAGAKVLYRRIRNAAKQVCGDEDSRQADVAAAAKACVDQAIVASVRAVNQQQLTRIAEAHGYAVETDLSVASVR